MGTNRRSATSFGYLTFAKELNHVGKLDDRSTLGVFISYA